MFQVHLLRATCQSLPARGQTIEANGNSGNFGSQRQRRKLRPVAVERQLGLDGRTRRAIQLDSPSPSINSIQFVVLVLFDVVVVVVAGFPFMTTNETPAGLITWPGRPVRRAQTVICIPGRDKWPLFVHSALSAASHSHVSVCRIDFQFFAFHEMGRCTAHLACHCLSSWQGSRALTQVAEPDTCWLQSATQNWPHYLTSGPLCVSRVVQSGPTVQSKSLR